MMRLLVTLAASTAISVIATSAALADPSGFVALSGGLDNLVVDFGGGSETADGSALQFLASGVYMFTPVLGAQGDIRAAFRTYDQGGMEADISGLDGAMHGFYREQDQFLVGAFFQFGGDQLSGGPFDIDVSRNYAGAEGQVYLDNLTLYGQVGLQQYEWNQSGSGISMNGWFGSLEARYFLTPDLRIEAHVGVSSYDLDFIETITSTTVNAGVGAEYKLESLPISLFATYDFYSTSYDYSGSSAPTFDEHRLMVGVKVAIGEDSLLERDRSGATLKPVEVPYQTPFSPIVP
jgi:hypothetical protein